MRKNYAHGMRTSPVLFAIVAAAVGAVYGCSLPLEGLSASANSGGSGGERSVTSAGGALSTATGTTTSASTSSGVSCTEDSECSGGTECKTPKCLSGACGFETAPHDGTVCGAASGPCFDDSLCFKGQCENRPKQAGTVVSNDNPGDCTSLRCDGTGESTAVADIMDLPMDPDNNDCSVPTCDGDKAGTKTLDNGAACGGNKHCFNGQCQECLQNSDCQDGKTCTDPVCNAGKCELKAVNNGNGCGIGGKCAGGACCGWKIAICGGGNECCLPAQHCNSQDHCVFF